MCRMHARKNARLDLINGCNLIQTSALNGSAEPRVNPGKGSILSCHFLWTLPPEAGAEEERLQVLPSIASLFLYCPAVGCLTLAQRPDLRLSKSAFVLAEKWSFC